MNEVLELIEIQLQTLISQGFHERFYPCCIKMYDLIEYTSRLQAKLIIEKIKHLYDHEIYEWDVGINIFGEFYITINSPPKIGGY